MASTFHALPEFHPQTVLRAWSNGDAFRLADTQTGLCAFGAIGSRKTSGPAKHLAAGYLAAEFGGFMPPPASPFCCVPPPCSL